MRAIPEIDAELEAKVEDLGFELVEVRWGGSGRRPVLKLRPTTHGADPGGPEFVLGVLNNTTLAGLACYTQMPRGVDVPS